MTNLRPSQVEVLKLIGENEFAPVTGDATTLSGPDMVYVNFQTAEALERRGLIEIDRGEDSDGYRAWECRLTPKGKEALDG